MYDRFSGIKFWSSERNTENTMLHLYFNEKSDYSENEVFRSTIERNYTYSRLSCRFITYSIRIGNLDWCKYQKQPLEVFCKKRCYLKLTGNSCTCFWNANIAITKREILIVFVAESWIECLLFRLKSQSAREASHHPTFMGICPTISHTY